MTESSTATTEKTTATPKRSTKTNTTSDTVWIVQRKLKGNSEIIGVYSTEESLQETYPELTKTDNGYIDCDSNGNGLTAASYAIA